MPDLPRNLLGTGELDPGHEARLLAEGVVHAWWVVGRGGYTFLGTSQLPLREVATQVLRTARQSLNGQLVRNMSCRKPFVESAPSVPFEPA